MPTATPAFQDGDPRPQRLSSRNILTWKAFRKIGITGIRRYGERVPWPSLSSLLGDALLFRTLATLRIDVSVFTSIDDLLWKGPTKDFKRTCERLKAPDLCRRALARAASQTLPQSPTVNMKRRSMKRKSQD